MSDLNCGLLMYEKGCCVPDAVRVADVLGIMQGTSAGLGRRERCAKVGIRWAAGGCREATTLALRCAWLGCVGWWLVGLLVGSPVVAQAIIVPELQGAGFAAPEQVAPSGGNNATNLGEQRRVALGHAFDAWSRRLDSSVPIRVRVSFEPLGCEGEQTLLGQTANVAWYTAINSPRAVPGRLYPSALADSLVGHDLDPDQPDIVMRLNSSVDEGCDAAGFYYGLDGRSEGQLDFVHVVLHELAHGLGLTTALDLHNGASQFGELIDVYAANIRDLELNRNWAELTNAERAVSVTRVRRLVWEGQRTQRFAARQLERGYPSLAFEPDVPGFSGVVSDSALGRNSARTPAAGPLVSAVNCDAPAGLAAGAVLLFPSVCRARSQIAQALQRANAVGAVMVAGSEHADRAQDADQAAAHGPIAQPVVVVSARDHDAIVAALQHSSLAASLGGDPERPLGTDAQSRPLLFASEPLVTGSSITHLDPLIRPDVLMEPRFAAGATHDLALTLAMLADIGWSVHCGDGRLDVQEACDDGPANSDAAAVGCRTDCSVPRCGDAAAHSGAAVCEVTASDHAAVGCSVSGAFGRAAPRGRPPWRELAVLMVLVAWRRAHKLRGLLQTARGEPSV